MTCHCAVEQGFHGKRNVSGWMGIPEATIAGSESHSLPPTEIKQKQLLCKECIGDWRRNVCLKGVCDMFNDLRGNDFIETRSGWEVTIAGSESHSLPQTREMKQKQLLCKECIGDWRRNVCFKGVICLK